MAQTDRVKTYIDDEHRKSVSRKKYGSFKVTTARNKLKNEAWAKFKAKHKV